MGKIHKDFFGSMQENLNKLFFGPQEWQDRLTAASDQARKVSEKIGCRRVLGHGEYCSAGHLCGGCGSYDTELAELARLDKIHDDIWDES